jgi:transposase-like protein
VLSDRPADTQTPYRLRRKAVVPTMPKPIALSNPDRAGEPLLVFGGVDTHADTHTVAAISHLGAMLGHQSFPATAKGYRQLYGWLAGHGTLMRVGMEGTSSYGAGLAAALTGHGVELVEVNRPARTTRRARGKSDPIDAEAAARAGLAGVATAVNRPEFRAASFLVRKDAIMPKHYDAEVKARAVRLVTEHKVESGSVTKSCEAVGRRLGISKETLRGWCRQAQVDAGERDGVTSEELAEIKRLKAENRRLREDVEILRAATTFFAGELDPRNR